MAEAEGPVVDPREPVEANAAEADAPGPLLRDPPPPPGYVDPVEQSDLLEHLSVRGEDDQGANQNPQVDNGVPTTLEP